jgi:hypothetical protein
MRHKSTFGAALAFALCACGSSAPPPETVTMMAQMSSGQSGTATLTDNGNGTTTVKITTTGGTDTGSQAAHIHSGTCGSNGNVYQPLTSVQGGTSMSMVPVGLANLQGGKYYINVHNSANAMNIQTCGNIQ